MNAWLPMLKSKFVPNEWNMFNAIIKIDLHLNKTEILFWFRFVGQLRHKYMIFVTQNPQVNYSTQ